MDMMALLDTFPQFDPDFDNEGTGFYCTVPLEWPNPWTRNPNHKGKYQGDCWQKFDTYGEVEAHRREAHAAWYADEVEYRRSKLMKTRPAPAPTPYTEKTELPFGEEQPDDKGMFSGGRSQPDGPSIEQIAYIASLAEQKGVAVPGVSTKKEASIAIDRLLMLPDVNPGLKPNRYAGQCTECNNRVAAEEGFVRQVDGKWLTAHKPGECPAAAAPLPTVPDGYYAISSEAGHTSFYSVKAGRKPGVTFVNLLVGGGSGGKLVPQSVGFDQRPAVLAKIAADVQGAGERFFAEASRCRRCGRGLTKEDSRKNGYGKDCAQLIQG